MFFLATLCQCDNVQIKGKSLLIGDNMFLITSGMLLDIFFFPPSNVFKNCPNRQNLASFQGFTNGKYLYSWSLIERNVEVLQRAVNKVALYVLTDRWQPLIAPPAPQRHIRNVFSEWQSLVNSPIPTYMLPPTLSFHPGGRE